MLQPLNYVVAILLALAVWVMATGGTTFHIAGHAVSLTMPHNLILVAYVIIFLRLAIAWRRHGQDWLASLVSRYRPLIAWHVWPVAIWFSGPKLGSFLWYLEPAARVKCRTMIGSAAFRTYATVGDRLSPGSLADPACGQQSVFFGGALFFFFF